MSDEAFLEVLASCTDAAANMDLSDDGWMPPDGTYDVIVEDVGRGVKPKNGVTNVWIKPSFQIIDGEFQGKSFTDFYYFSPSPSEPTISMKNLCRFATCLQGCETKNIIEAAEIAQAAVGEVLKVEVYRTLSKKTSKEYANVRFLARHDAVTVDAAAPTEEAQ